MDVFDTGDGIPSKYVINLLGVHGDSLSGNDVVEKVCFRDMEHVFLEFAKNTNLFEFGNDGADVRDVFFLCGAVHEHVVEVNNTNDIQVFSECLIHEVLEYSRGVSQAKGDDEVFK